MAYKEESFPQNVPQKMFALNVVSKKLPNLNLKKKKSIEKNPLLELHTKLVYFFFLMNKTGLLIQCQPITIRNCLFAFI